MNSSKIAIAVVAGLALVTGIAWGSLMVSSGSADGAGAGAFAWAVGDGNGADVGAELAEIRSALDQERSERLALAEELEALREELDLIAPYEGDDSEYTVGSYEADEPEVSAAPPGAPPAAPHGFDEKRLAEVGLPEREIERLRERFDQTELDQLYLRDRATREGWLNRPRYRNAADKQRAQLREDLGDDDYDLMLYAAGRRNRVGVQRVMRGSPGEASGLQVGDIILAYNDDRIFSPRDLQRATTSTPAGSSSTMLILRGGEERRLYIPGGPIGIASNPTSLAPRYP